MSYNVTSTKVTKIQDFKIPLKEFFKFGDFAFDQDGFLFWESEIKGKIEGDYFKITEVQIFGEASGHLMTNVFEPLFKKSSGVLEAVMVWEGGDSVTKLKVNNGKVTEEEVEL